MSFRGRPNFRGKTNVDSDADRELKKELDALSNVSSLFSFLYICYVSVLYTFSFQTLSNFHIDSAKKKHRNKDNGNDIFNVSEFAPDIFKYFKHRQVRFPICDYLKKRRNLTKKMRALLVHWLVNFQEQFEMKHETMYLAVKIIDLFLSRSDYEVEFSKLRLLGGTAMFLAAKYIVSYFFLYYCSNTYIF